VDLNPRQKRVWLAWQGVWWVGIITIVGLMLLSANRGIDPESWAPLVFGGVIVGFGIIMAAFPGELDAVFRKQAGQYGYAGGFPLRGAGIFFVVVGGFTMLQALLA
jgi:hypothetical protein